MHYPPPLPRVLLVLYLGMIGAGLCGEGRMEIDYPVPYVLFQRQSETDGTLRVRGRYPPSANPGRIEARFCGRAWQVLDPAPKDGRFAGSFGESIGQGDLELRAVGDPSLGATVTPVGIGDLFVVTGQSNADGRGDAVTELDPQNPFVGVKFRRNAWSRGDDPSANDVDAGSPWPMVLNTLIPDQKVPIGYIQAAVGSTVVRQWRQGGDMFARMLQIVKAATDGSMAMRAVLYYQGENDITHYNTLSVLGNYEQYRENLLAATTDFHQALPVPFLLGQITNLLSERDRNDNVRRVQQELCGAQPWLCRGAVTYDILPSDGVHYRVEPNLRCFAGRWTAAILAAVYGRAEFTNPCLRRARCLDPTTLQLEFDRDLRIASWDGKVAEKAMGFSLRAGSTSLGDGDVLSTTVAGNVVTLKLAKPVPPEAVLYYGSGADGQGQPTLRDARTDLPVLMVFASPLQRE